MIMSNSFPRLSVGCSPAAVDVSSPPLGHKSVADGCSMSMVCRALDLTSGRRWIWVHAWADGGSPVTGLFWFWGWLCNSQNPQGPLCKVGALLCCSLI
jgi:hypothetical protein